jgi:hypothetical protein
VSLGGRYYFIGVNRSRRGNCAASAILFEMHVQMRRPEGVFLSRLVNCEGALSTLCCSTSSASKSALIHRWVY